jgi:hypothetical protein
MAVRDGSAAPSEASLACRATARRPSSDGPAGAGCGAAADADRTTAAVCCSSCPESTRLRSPFETPGPEALIPRGAAP